MLFHHGLSASSHLIGMSNKYAGPDDCPDCYVLTQDDINSSPTLKSYNAYAGDMISEENKLIRTRKARYDAFKRAADLSPFFRDPIFHLLWLFWLITGLVNYVIIGTFRFLPWKVIDVNS